VRPTFLVIGAGKAGTSTLCHHLRSHPQIFMTRRKELHFFSLDEIYAHGFEWYERWFSGAGERPQRGEGSTTYTGHTVFPRTAERIAAYAPDMRLIYIARDPLERMESVWMQLRRLGATSPFRDLGVHTVPPEMQVDLDFNRSVVRQATAIVESTNYWREISAYRRHFPDEQILVLLFEDLKRDPRAVMRRCYAFLGVDPGFAAGLADVHLNSLEHYRHAHGALWRLWASPRRRRVYSSAAQLVPKRVRRWLNRNLLRTRVLERPRWEPETRAFAWERLGGDLERFLDFYSLPRDAWRLPF
jgi:hypothetical protein